MIIEWKFFRRNKNTCSFKGGNRFSPYEKKVLVSIGSNTYQYFFFHTGDDSKNRIFFVIILCILCIAAYLAACIFNEGSSSTLMVMNELGIKIGSRCFSYAEEIDNRRVSRQNRRSALELGKLEKMNCKLKMKFMKKKKDYYMVLESLINQSVIKIMSLPSRLCCFQQFFFKRIFLETTFLGLPYTVAQKVFDQSF